jgi:hypothetical protein
VRKWRIIALLAGILTVVGVFVLRVTNSPNEGENINGWTRLRISYYQREFRAARDATKTAPGASDLPVEELRTLMKRMEAAQKKLVDLGYLAELKFFTTNQPPDVVALRVVKRDRATFKKPTTEFRDLWAGRNFVVIICRPEYVPTYEGFVKDADVPEAK